MANSANSIPIPFAATSEAEAEPEAGRARAAPAMTLAAMAIGVPARVVSLDLDDEQRAWVSAVGISEGEKITVLRRAIFGGPIHVRTGVGGEFALNRQLARSIHLASWGAEAREAVELRPARSPA